MLLIRWELFYLIWNKHSHTQLTNVLVSIKFEKKKTIIGWLCFMGYCNYSFCYQFFLLSSVISSMMCVNNWFQWKYMYNSLITVPENSIIENWKQHTQSTTNTTNHHYTNKLMSSFELWVHQTGAKKKWGLKHNYNTNYNKCNSMCENGQVNGKKNGHWICICFSSFK